MSRRDPDRVRHTVRESYAPIAERRFSGCGPSASPTSCCAPEPASSGCCGKTAEDAPSSRLGYSDAELRAAPEGSNLGLGCGNPQAIAALEPGETVLDLGSGGGFDCFLAARQVGPKGRVIGVDMTPEMVEKARSNARDSGALNVEFRLGEIEHLPVADGSIDVIISNCVINLSPEKPRVYREAFRVLKPGGRLAIADVVTTARLPEEIRSDLEEWAGCMSGADSIDEIGPMLESAGFRDVCIRPLRTSRELLREWTPGGKLADYVVSASIEATKPLP